MFLFELSLPPDRLAEFLYLFGLVPGRSSHPGWVIGGVPLHTYWTFLTCTFLHGGLVHLIGNMWSL